jgi:diaminopropionate ammonia-lyase
MHETTKNLISQEGALVTVVDGDYDDAVRTAESRSDECNGILVQDTAWPGYEKIPRVSMGSRVTRVSMDYKRLNTSNQRIFLLGLLTADCK